MRSTCSSSSKTPQDRRWSSGSGRRAACRRRSFISVAAEQLGEMVITRQDSVAGLTVLGTRRRRRPTCPDFRGRGVLRDPVQPRHVHAEAAAGQLVGRGVTLPAATKRSVRLDGYRLELPGRDDVDAFVAKLVRTGLLEHDPVPQAAVHGPADGLLRARSNGEFRERTGGPVAGSGRSGVPNSRSGCSPKGWRRSTSRSMPATPTSRTSLGHSGALWGRRRPRSRRPRLTANRLSFLFKTRLAGPVVILPSASSIP